MLSDHVDAAIRGAEYKQLTDDSWWGHIPDFKGLWAEGPSQEECRIELTSALEDWIVFSLRRQLPVPVVDGIDLTVTEVA